MKTRTFKITDEIRKFNIPKAQEELLKELKNLSSNSTVEINREVLERIANKLGYKPQTLKQSVSRLVSLEYLTILGKKSTYTRKKHLSYKPGTPEYSKASYIKFAYGITMAEFHKLQNDQNLSCAICGKKQSTLVKKLHIDHCHKTKKVRGLLCFNCNSAIGHFKDDVNLLKLAIKYLEKD